ncbi:hypothetical protein PHISCL_06616 [Aspergillus sclerotialis]|uniref:Uncharacterized protein n=1 Tax=Aspergillus sclerotialis TaxID=2070753 RepID=A0A3A2ZSU2_9EURO|nr:hypothetical protein PHISCL_06616 [Aspergillus sclerotialis]
MSTKVSDDSARHTVIPKPLCSTSYFLAVWYPEMKWTTLLVQGRSAGLEEQAGSEMDSDSEEVLVDQAIQRSRGSILLEM